MSTFDSMNKPDRIIPCQRHLFTIPDEIAYLNCAYLSPQLKRVSEAGRNAILRKESPWRVTPADFFTDAETLRSLFAKLVRAGTDDIALVPSVSYGIAIAAQNLPVEKGKHIVVIEDQFPSNIYAWQILVRATDAEIITVAQPPDEGWTNAVIDKISEQTAIVAVPNCHWADGALLDLVKIGARCRETGAALVVDATQSLGVVPFSVQDVQPDFLLAAGYKWLLGPYSLGYLYVHPRHQGGQPIENNWINRLGSEDFGGLVSYRDEYQPGARRFDVGEKSNFALLPMAIAALEQVLGWCVGDIDKTLAAVTAEIASEARQIGLNVAPDHLRGSHIVGLRFPGGVPAALPETLLEKKIYVSVRGNAVRIAPHLYNSDEDLDRFLQTLRSVIQKPGS